jgi:hypothetical protein
MTLMYVCVYMSGVCNVCVCKGFVMGGCFWKYVYCTFTQVFLNLTEVFLTLTEIFPCFFLSCKANARVKLAKTGHGPHSSTLVCICVVRLLFVLFYVLFVCKCILPPGDNPIAVNKYIVSNNKYPVSVKERGGGSVLVQLNDYYPSQKGSGMEWVGNVSRLYYNWLKYEISNADSCWKVGFHIPTQR